FSELEHAFGHEGEDNCDSLQVGGGLHPAALHAGAGLPDLVKLFDPPAAVIVAKDGESRSRFVDGLTGQQHPLERLDAFWWIDLTRVNDADIKTRGPFGTGSMRPAQLDAPHANQ